MSFVPRTRRSRARSTREFRVWAVGSRAYVHCGTEAAVVLTDEYERVANATLEDGVEVEVCAWRPHGMAGPRYHVRACDDGVDGWIGGEYLRATREPPPAAPPEEPGPALRSAAGFVSYSRRFGQR
ncbi:MAG TPA: hypothetical protein VNO26_13890 [Candidatus Limnocylindria bacterium]|nr:hypothetical protein [Candidatus Limnocylindria bacterium]